MRTGLGLQSSHGWLIAGGASHQGAVGKTEQGISTTVAAIAGLQQRAELILTAHGPISTMALRQSTN